MEQISVREIRKLCLNPLYFFCMIVAPIGSLFFLMTLMQDELPTNLPVAGELLEAQIACLKGEDFTLYPDFPRGGIVDVSEYDHGNGRMRCRVRLKQPDDKTIVITELPYNITTQGLIESIEKAEIGRAHV